MFLALAPLPTCCTLPFAPFVPTLIPSPSLHWCYNTSSTATTLRRMTSSSIRMEGVTALGPSPLPVQPPTPAVKFLTTPCLSNSSPLMFRSPRCSARVSSLASFCPVVFSPALFECFQSHCVRQFPSQLLTDSLPPMSRFCLVLWSSCLVSRLTTLSSLVSACVVCVFSSHFSLSH